MHTKAPEPTLVKVRLHLKSGGWLSTARRALAFVARECQSSVWDLVHNVDTRSCVPVARLAIPDEDASLAVYYQPSTTALREFLASLKLPFCDFDFVDLGAGKGRACLIAASFPFRRVIGVEISPVLVAIARRNIERYRPRNLCSRVDIVCCNAKAYQFSDGPLLLYAYNPFQGAVMRQVLDRLEESLRLRPRAAFFVYRTATQRRIVAQYDFLRLVHDDGEYLVYESSIR